MAREITWTDTLEIGIMLQEKHPEIEPYRFALLTCTSTLPSCRALLAIPRSRTRASSRRFRLLGTRNTRTPSRTFQKGYPPPPSVSLKYLFAMI